MGFSEPGHSAHQGYPTYAWTVTTPEPSGLATPGLGSALRRRRLDFSLKALTSPSPNVIALELLVPSPGRYLVEEALAEEGFVPLPKPNHYVTYGLETDQWTALTLNLTPHEGPSLGRPAAAGKNLPPGSRLGQGLKSCRPRGISVALMAPDGAGKSTLVLRLQQSIPLAVEVIYMGPYREARWMDRISHIPGPGVAIRIARAWWRYSRGMFHRLRGRIVLFDRYTYDALAVSTDGLNPLVRGHLWLVGHACPPPDLTIVLDAPAEVLWRRKQEHGVDSLEKARQAFLRFAHQRDAMIIDAAQPLEEVCRQVTRLIWTTYSGRIVG